LFVFYSYSQMNQLRSNYIRQTKEGYSLFVVLYLYTLNQNHQTTEPSRIWG